MCLRRASFQGCFPKLAKMVTVRMRFFLSQSILPTTTHPPTELLTYSFHCKNAHNFACYCCFCRVLHVSRRPSFSHCIGKRVVKHTKNFAILPRRGVAGNG